MVLLTFYHFVDLANPQQFADEHRDFLQDIGMRGRIYFSTEGISSTVTGNEGQVKAYKLFLKSIPEFADIADIDSKAMEVDSHQFPRMTVKVREEIVTMGKKYTAEQIRNGGNRVSVEEFKKIVDSGDSSYVFLDMRNDHEYQLGHFKGAVPANTVTFRELETVVEDYKKKYKDKHIITYCTGGIRCEKATVMMREAGLNNVSQLDGGVVKYINTYDDGNWLGNLYTFDDRVSTHVGSETTHTTIGKCLYTGAPTDNCCNCRHALCNARIIAEEKTWRRHMGFCSRECATNALEDLFVRNVPWDKTDYIEARRTPEGKDAAYRRLKGKLNGVEFNHTMSQKESIIHMD